MATTIQLSIQTRDHLKLFGHKGETYDDIITRLLSYCDEFNLEELIEERWKKLQKEKEEYVSLDEI